jgi:hypothetical protein
MRPYVITVCLYVCLERNKKEIDTLIEGADIVRFIKAQKIKLQDIYNEWTKQDQPESY